MLIPARKPAPSTVPPRDVGRFARRCRVALLGAAALASLGVAAAGCSGSGEPVDIYYGTEVGADYVLPDATARDGQDAGQDAGQDGGQDAGQADVPQGAGDAAPGELVDAAQTIEPDAEEAAPDAGYAASGADGAAAG